MYPIVVSAEAIEWDTPRADGSQHGRVAVEISGSTTAYIFVERAAADAPVIIQQAARSTWNPHSEDFDYSRQPAPAMIVVDTTGWLTAKEAGTRARHKDGQMIVQLIKRGRLSGYKHGVQWFVEPERFAAWLENRTVGRPPTRRD